MIAVLLVASAALACRPVAGGRILGSDLAAAVPALAALPADTVIGYAPRPGAQRVFLPGELARLAGTAGVTPRDPLLPSVCFERAAAPLDRERVLAALRRSLGLPEARLEIVELSRYPAPAGELVFPRESLVEPASGDTAVWKGYVTYETSASIPACVNSGTDNPRGQECLCRSCGRFPVWARVRIGVRERRLVAAIDIQAGQKVGADAVRVEETEGFPRRVRSLSAPADAVGRVARRLIPEGAPVAAAALEAPHDIERGDTVEVEVRSGLAVLKLDARAEGSGRRGGEIALRNTATGKTFRARVEGRGRAVLEFGREGYR